MSPKWQRPSGTEQESGTRTYVSGKEYPEQMRMKTDKASLDEAPFHLSEFKKPYQSDTYDEMEHFFSWPNWHRYGFDWPLEDETGMRRRRGTTKYLDALEWDPTLDVVAIEANDSDTVGVIHNEGSCKWKVEESGLTAGSVTMGPTGKNKVRCLLSPSIDADGFFNVRATDSRKANKWIWRRVNVTPKTQELLLEVHVTFYDGSPIDITRYFRISDLVTLGGDLGDFWTGDPGYDNCYGRVNSTSPAYVSLLWKDTDTPSLGFIQQYQAQAPTDIEWDYDGPVTGRLKSGASLWFGASIIQVKDYAYLTIGGQHYADGHYVLNVPMSGTLWSLTGGGNYYTAPLRFYSNISSGFDDYGGTGSAILAKDLYSYGVGVANWNSSPTLTDTYYMHFGSGIGLITLPDPRVTVMDTGKSGWEYAWAEPESNPEGTLSTGTAWTAGKIIDISNYCALGTLWNGVVDEGEGKNGDHLYGKEKGVTFDVDITKDKYPEDITYTLNIVSGIPY